MGQLRIFPSCDETPPIGPDVFSLPWLRSTNPTINWSTLSLTFKNGPSISVTIIGFGKACSTAALRHKDIISDLSPVFASIPELCTASGPSLLTKNGRECPNDVFCQVGAILVKTLCPLLDPYLGTDMDFPTSTSCMGSVVLFGFPHQTHSS